MTCVMNDTSHECLKVISLDKNCLFKWVFQMTCFCDDSDLHDIKKRGVKDEQTCKQVML